MLTQKSFFAKNIMSYSPLLFPGNTSLSLPTQRCIISRCRSMKNEVYSN